VDPNKESNKEKNKELNTRRATRLPSNWQPTEQDRQFARDKGLSENDIDFEAEKIRNWSANNSPKLDWPAAWRNWILRSIDPSKGGQRREDKTSAGFRPTRGSASALAGIDRYFEGN
jgi:hypothetical protein